MVRAARKRNTRKGFALVAMGVTVVAIMMLGSGVLGNGVQSSGGIHLGSPITQGLYTALYAASEPPYGPSGGAYMGSVTTVTGQPLYAGAKPILLSVTGEFCSHCALQRWPLVLALMRFGNFTNLEYMTSSPTEGNYSTFSLAESRYTSSYLVFESYEAYDRAGIPLERLPSNYSAADQQLGGSLIPFLDFAGKYVVSGAMIPDASVLGSKNWTQVALSIEGGDSLGVEIKGAANAITSVICEITDWRPMSVCGQPGIMMSTGAAYYATPAGQEGALTSMQAVEEPCGQACPDIFARP